MTTTTLVLGKHLLAACNGVKKQQMKFLDYMKRGKFYCSVEALRSSCIMTVKNREVAWKEITDELHCRSE